MQFLLTTIANVDLPQSVISKSPCLCVELVELMAAAQKEGKISAELTKQTMLQFFKQKVFSNEGAINESVCIISKDDKEVHFNQTLLHWSLEKAEFITQTPPYSVDYSAETLGFLKKFLYTNNVPFQSLVQVVELYDLSHKYNYVELQLFCEKIIKANYETLNTEEKLLVFTEKVNNANLPLTIKQEFTSKALLTCLKSKNIDAHPSNDAHQICLSASHVALLMNENAYGKILREHVNGFIISNNEGLNAALVFDYLNEKIKAKFIEISFFTQTDHLSDYLKLIFPIFPNLSIYNVQIANESNRSIECLTRLPSLLSPFREVTIRIVNYAGNQANPSFYLSSSEEKKVLKNMRPILCDEAIKLLVSKHNKVKPQEIAAFSNFQVTRRNPEPLFKGGMDYTCYILDKKGGV